MSHLSVTDVKKIKKKPNLRKKHLYGDYLVGKRIELVDDYLLTIIHAREG